jgi:uncharacterized membrane protein
MNAALFHLMFTHLPIVGLLFALLINIYAIVRKNDELRKLTLWCYMVLGVFALIAYLTGDGAAEIIKTYPGISADHIEEHENYALMFLIGVLILSALAALGIYMTKTKEKLLKKFSLYLLIGAVLISILAIKTGSSGGEIRHTETENGVFAK